MKLRILAAHSDLAVDRSRRVYKRKPDGKWKPLDYFLAPGDIWLEGLGKAQELPRKAS